MPRSQSMTCGLPPSRIYSAASSSSSIVALGPRFKQDRPIDLADRFEQPIVLHIAGADLQHVGILGDQFAHPRWPRLRSRRPGRFPRGPWRAFAGLHFQSLKAVRAGPRFEGPAAQRRRPGRLHRLGRGDDLLFAFDRTGPAITPMCCRPTVKLPARTMVGSGLTSRLATL